MCCVHWSIDVRLQSRSRFKMDVEYDSELSDTDYEEIDDSDTIRQYMYEPIRRERDEGFLMTLIFRFFCIMTTECFEKRLNILSSVSLLLGCRIQCV